MSSSEFFRSRSTNNSNNVCNVNNDGSANNNNYNNTNNGLAPDQMELSRCKSSCVAAQTSNNLNSTPEYVIIHLIMVYSGCIGSIKSQEGNEQTISTISNNILKVDASSSKENLTISPNKRWINKYDCRCGSPVRRPLSLHDNGGRGDVLDLFRAFLQF